MSPESPFWTYIKTNNAPSALEVDGIASLIADRKEAASEIRTRLERLAKEAQVLQGQLDQHTLYIDEHKAITSGVRRLPDNALVRIFLATGDHARFSPIAISHVSHQWRKVALDTPLLWTSIGAHIPENPTVLEKAGRQPTLEKVATYLERSGALGLSIGVTADPVHLASREERYRIHETLAAALEPTSSRWREVYACVPPDSPLMRLLQVVGTSVEALESLSIDFEPPFRLKGESPNLGTPPPESIINAWNAPSLTVLSLEHMSKSMAEANVALSINWSQLSYLNLGPSVRAHLTQHHVLRILSACTNLEHLSLKLHDPVFHATSPEPLPGGLSLEVTLPRLSIVELHGCEVAMRGLASKLTLPSLTTLITLFNQASYSASEEESALAEWLDRFGQQLLAVSFDYVTLTQSALAYCLARLPNVVELKMIGMAWMTLWPFMLTGRRDKSRPKPAIINDDILESLTPRFTNPEGDADAKVACLCPRLQRIEWNMGVQERSKKAFINFILARYGDGTKLELPGGVSRIDQVVLAFNYEKPQGVGELDIVEEVDRAVDASDLDIYVQYREPFDFAATESLVRELKALREK